jgi:hypothetical protein
MISTRHSAIGTCLLLGAVLLLGIPSKAAAQTQTEADSIKVSLWPEYDRSEVLVIYRIALPTTTGLPTQLRLLVPPDAPDLTAAAYRDATGGLLNAAYTRSEGELADVIEVEAAGSEVQLEFYLPLDISGDLRQFSFVWPGGLGARDFAFEVQQPLGAQGMQVDPAASSQTTDSLGLTYHLVDLGALTADDQPEVSFRYDNATSQLSADSAGPPGALATPAPASGRPLDVRVVLPWLLLIAGVGLIGGGVVYFLRSRSEERPARPRHRTPKPPAEREDRVDASPIFCHNCGTQATAADRFCRQCGTALRV